MTDAINMHSEVLLHYSISLTDNTVIESTFDEEPVKITMGHGDLTDGMELAIFGLNEDDEQSLQLSPEQGFGLRDEDNINEMPVSDFPDDLPPEAGLSYSFGGPNDEEIPGTVISIKDDLALIDFNHPLAGQEIIFRVKILGINNTHTENDL